MSLEFHQPILSMYSRLRRCPNIVLIAGSGFGGAEDTYPYLNGTWARKFGYPPMPFDGVLFGSRCMVAKEAHTSKMAKQAIVDAQETDTELVLRRWKNTSRLFKNKVASQAVKIERESTTGEFSEVAEFVSGKRGRQVFLNGDKDYGVRHAAILLCV